MANNNKNQLAIGLCLFVVASIIGALFNASIEWFKWYDQTVATVVFIATDLIAIAAIVIILTTKDAFLNIIGKISSFGAIVLSLIFAINNILAPFFGINLLSFLGNNISIISQLIYFAIIALFVIFVRTPVFVRLCIIIAHIPSLISSFQISKIPFAVELMNRTGDDTMINGLTNMIRICNYSNLVLNIVAVALVIIWVNQREVAPSLHQKPIDLI